MNTGVLVYIILHGINLIFLLTKWRFKQLEMPFKVYIGIPIAVITVETFSEVFFSKIDNDLFLYHLFAPIEYSVYAWFFYCIIRGNVIRKLIILSIPILSLLAAIAAFTFQPITENNSFFTLLESGLIIFYCLLYLRQILLLEVHKRAEQNPFFWIITGLLFYFLQLFFVESFLKYLMEVSAAKAVMYYRFCNVFKYINCSLTFIGLLVHSANLKKQTLRVRS